MTGRVRPGSRPLAPAAALLVVVVLAAWSGPGAFAVVRARPTPPPTSIHGTPSPFPTVLQTPRPGLRAPAIRAAAATLDDLSTGQSLFDHRPNTRRPIASLTKIMTALLVLERTEPTDVVRASAHAAATPGSVLGLEPGERMSVRNLTYALMLQSSNDAAVALAERVGRTEEGFVALMNDEAHSIGLRDSRFFSPNGLDDRGYSTASDLARLTRAAEAQAEFSTIVRTKERTITSVTGPNRHVQNRNVLLWLYRGATGVKTGFTSPAGYCLVATAERDGRALVTVLLGEPSEERAFSDGAALFNFGFSAFSPVTLRQGQAVGTVTVDGQPVGAQARSAFSRLIPKGELPNVELRLIPTPGLHLPIQADARVGTLVLFLEAERLGSVVAVATTAVKEAPSPPAEPTAGPAIDQVALVLGLLVRSVFGSFL